MPRSSSSAGGKRPSHASTLEVVGAAAIEAPWVTELRRMNQRLEQICEALPLRNHNQGPPLEEDERLQVLTVKEAAKLLKIGATGVYAAAAAGRIPAIKIGGRIVIPIVGLLRLINEASQRKQEEAAQAAE